MKRHGFTLVELFVVLGVIALLAAVLVPVFALVRARAKQTTCLSNLRQLALAVQAYAQDNNDYIPPYNSWFNGRPPTEENHYITEHGAELVACLGPYTHNRDIWFCPEDIYARTSSSAGGVNHLSLSYATSLVWFDPNWQLGHTRINFTTPLADAAPSQGLPLLSDDPWGWAMRSPIGPDPLPPPYSHRGRFLYVMFDGHVRSF